MAILTQISNHLNSLGYSLEDFTIGEKEGVIASRSTDNNITLFEISPNFVILEITLLSYKPITNEMKDFVNQANRVLSIAKAYWFSSDDGNAALKLNAIYNGKYTKETFTVFYELLKGDVDHIISQPLL